MLLAERLAHDRQQWTMLQRSCCVPLHHENDDDDDDDDFIVIKLYFVSCTFAEQQMPVNLISNVEYYVQLECLGLIFKSS